MTGWIAHDWLYLYHIRLCALPVEIISQPFYCHRCALNDLHPSEGSDWNMSLISRFKGIAMDTEFQMKVKILKYKLKMHVTKPVRIMMSRFCL